jgi:hypothetical protein
VTCPINGILVTVGTDNPGADISKAVISAVSDMRFFGFPHELAFWPWFKWFPLRIKDPSS